VVAATVVTNNLHYLIKGDVRGRWFRLATSNCAEGYENREEEKRMMEATTKYPSHGIILCGLKCRRYCTDGQL